MPINTPLKWRETWVQFPTEATGLEKLHQTCSALCIYKTILELSEYSGISVPFRKLRQLGTNLTLFLKLEIVMSSISIFESEDSIKTKVMIKSLMEWSPYFLMIKKFYLFTRYDIIMKLSKFSELSEDYIAEMWVKLGSARKYQVNRQAFMCLSF